MPKSTIQSAWVSVRIAPSIRKKLLVKAKKDNRSVSGYVKVLIEKAVSK